MTTTPPDTSHPQGPAPDSGPRVGWDDIRDLGRIRRTRADRRVAGVAGGLGRHLDIDPVILRVAFVVLTFFGGVGILLYLALWLLVPEEGRDWATIKLDRRSRTVALMVVGVLAVVFLFYHSWWGDPGPIVLLAAIVGAVVVALQLTRRDRPQPGPGAEPHPYPTYDAPGATAGPTPAQPATQPGTQPAGPPFTSAVTAPVTDQTGDAYPPAPPPPTTYAVPEQPRPVNPRKRGPILFWFSLALMGVVLGTLGIADLAGAPIPPSAYPASVLAVSALTLLIGSFFGRAGGIILVGLLAGAATVGATVADRWDPHSSTVVPASASQVDHSYSMDVGELIVDLDSVRDPQNLDGRTITVTGNVGHLEVEVPDDVTVVAETHVTGVGGINVFDRSGGGVDTQLTAVHDAGPHAPRLTLDVELHVGGIDVHSDPRSLR